MYICSIDKQDQVITIHYRYIFYKIKARILFIKVRSKTHKENESQNYTNEVGKLKLIYKVIGRGRKPNSIYILELQLGKND